LTNKKILNNIFTSLNNKDIDVLTIMSTFIILRISNLFLTNKDYLRQLKKNNDQDIKSIILLLLPYIDSEKNIYEKITDLNELILTSNFSSSDLKKERYDILKTHFKYTNIGIGLINSNNNIELSDSKYEKLIYKMLYHNFIALNETLSIINGKLYVNWLNIYPLSEDNYKISTIYNSPYSDTVSISSNIINLDGASEINVNGPAYFSDSITTSSLFTSIASVSTLSVSTFSFSNETVNNLIVNSSLTASSISGNQLAINQISTGIIFASLADISSLNVSSFVVGQEVITSSLTVNSTLTASTIFGNRLGINEISTGFIFASLANISTLDVSTLHASKLDVSTLEAYTISTNFLTVNSTLMASTINTKTLNFETLNGLLITTNDLIVNSTITTSSIRSSTLYSNVIEFSSLCMVPSNISTFTGPAKSSILICLGGSYWKIAIEPA